MHTEAELQKLLREEMVRDHAYPIGRFSGRGIVICGGGKLYFTCAWVCINMLRRLGCDLPIELWHFGNKEMLDEMMNLVLPLNVQTVDALAVKERFPVRILNGWELKPFSIIHSRFEEVLFLDADNVPVVNPEFLFDCPPYHETGAVFWPDFGRLDASRDIWRVCDVPYRDEPEFESGQMIIDKQRCWKALQLTMHLNEYSDFYYRHIHGDKETFHIAWRMLNQEYSMPETEIHPLVGVMCQHDFAGRRIFQHRNLRKWTLEGVNPMTEGFLYESDCLAFLDELRQKWVSFSPENRWLFDQVVNQREYLYSRVGYDKRTLEFLSDFTIGEGADRMERRWEVGVRRRKACLRIFGESGLTCELEPVESGVFRGRWLDFERMEVLLLPIRSDV